jgi:carbon storage regulator
MLVLSRKLGEKVVLSNGITLTVIAIRGDRVRLAFDGPDQVRILRAELGGWPPESAGGDGLAEPACEYGVKNVHPPQG